MPFQHYEAQTGPDNLSTGFRTMTCPKQLTHCSRETRKRVTGKQCRPWSDATERGVWSGSPLFENSLAIFL